MTRGILLWLRVSVAQLLAVAALTLCAGCYHTLQPLPDGVCYAGPQRPAQDLAFLKDATYVNADGVRFSDQEIFDEVFKMIRDARRFVLIDFFLYNEFQGQIAEDTRALTRELTDALTAQKHRFPGLRVIVITDPINNVYGGQRAPHLEELEAAGMTVAVTDLNKLRDSNFLYSGLWRLLVRPFGTGEGRLMANPFGPGRTSLRSCLALLNFKANHRKLVIADRGSDAVALVTSANPHDGSSAHSNVAVRFAGAAVTDLLKTELAVLAFSGMPVPEVSLPAAETGETVGTLQVLTEREIERAVLHGMARAQKGDALDLVMFYLSDRDVIRALKRAHGRGVELRILLDPNKDAFGRPKNGIPNRQVAHELNRRGIPIRWFDTHGEQCHAKMLLLRYRADSSGLVLLGSANFTRRNLDNLNLETDVAVRVPADSGFFRDAQAWFDLLWHNSADRHFSVSYADYAEKSCFKTLLSRFMEATGMSTF